jgi:hypothetical protein
VLNRKFISHMQHNEGGQYYVFLNDDDECCLPVGRSYVPILKDNKTIIRLP